MRHSAILAGAEIAPNVKSELIDYADLQGLTLLYDNIFFRHGPEIRVVQLRLDEVVRRYLSANQDIRQVVTDVHVRYLGLELNHQSQTPGDNPRIGPTRFEDWGFTFPPSPAGALPTEVFNSDCTLKLKGATLMLKYYGPAHTDSDISIFFTEADVFLTGDTWCNGHFPFIDYSTGGSIKGMIRAAESNLATVTEKTIVIPGHGPVGNKSRLVEYRDLLVTIRDKIAALKKQGKSRDEIVAAKPTAAYDARWGRLFIDGDFLTRLVYAGV